MSFQNPVFIPGPTNIPDVIRKACDMPTLDHRSAEFAVIIPDAWQRRGIGAALTDVCLRVAKDWGLREITAVTMPENDRMIAIFKARRFKIQRSPDGSTIYATKKI